MKAWFPKIAQRLWRKKKESEPSAQEWWLRLYPFLKVRVDVERLTSIEKVEERRLFLEKNLGDLEKELRLKLKPEVRDYVLTRWFWEVWGFGPLETLLQNPEITDILINGPHEIYQEVHGILERTELQFEDSRHLMNHVLRVLSEQGHRVDLASPQVDSKLKDGSRLNVVVAPIAPKGPVVSIRKFVHDKMTLDDLQQAGSLPERLKLYLHMVVQARLNMIVSGATGSGKTTLLNAVLAVIPEDERLVVIEDTAELALEHRHAVRLLTRTDNLLGTNRVTQRDLLKNALRMRPDRILIGEVRGDEVMEMLQAMNTGHDGSLSTIHASYVEEVPTRLANLASMTELSLTTDFILKQIASSVNVIVQIGRYRDGGRRLAQVSEVTGYHDGRLQFTHIYQLTFDAKSRQWQERLTTQNIQEYTLQKARERGVSEEFIQRVISG